MAASTLARWGLSVAGGAVGSARAIAAAAASKRAAVVAPIGQRAATKPR
jgi:hypothetical protein